MAGRANSRVQGGGTLRRRWPPGARMPGPQRRPRPPASRAMTTWAGSTPWDLLGTVSGPQSSRSCGFQKQATGPTSAAGFACIMSPTFPPPLKNPRPGLRPRIFRRPPRTPGPHQPPHRILPLETRRSSVIRGGQAVHREFLPGGWGRGKNVTPQPTGQKPCWRRTPRGRRKRGMRGRL